MKRCPKCKRFGVEYDSFTGVERCVWGDCLWINRDHLDLEHYDYGINFQKFRDSIEKKSLQA
ncbi:MAG: hypothetical protein KAS46_05295 [Candidatus Aureabacteria bacterium]|nr:hypothetical protein [Candidatus Auribacterota bacterium]